MVQGPKHTPRVAAKAGTRFFLKECWIPAFAGMSGQR